MIRNTAAGLLALLLALLVPAMGVAEELGEMDLYDPAIFVDGGDAPMPGDNLLLPEETLAPEDLPEADETEWFELEPEDGDDDGDVLFEDAPEAPLQPAPEDAGEEAPSQMIEPTAEATAEPTVEPAPEPTPEPAAEPTAESTPEPTPEPAAEALPEPIGEPAPEAEPADDPDAEVAAPEAAVAARALEPDLKLGVGESYALDGAARLKGAGGVEGYASSDAGVAAVDAKTGLIEAKKAGMAEIAVRSTTGEIAVVGVAVLGAPGSAAFEDAAVALGKGETRALRLRLPEGSASARVSYTSSRKSVVSVDAQGNLRARKPGKATITAVTYNGKRASCKVKVYKAPKKLGLSAYSMAVCVGETAALKARLPKKSASAVSWQSSDASIATVDAQGGVRGAKAGTATITARTFNGKTASCRVQVLAGKPPTQLALNTEGLRLGKKEKFALTPAIGPGEETVYAYATSNKRVAAVSADGVITAKKAGSAKISVRTHNGLAKVIKVKVTKAPKKVKVSPGTLILNAGQAGQLAARFNKGASSQLTWTSADPAVASVDGSGAVTALKAGATTVTARAFNGKKGAANVRVLAGKPPTKLTLNAASVQLGVKERFLLSPTVEAGEEAVYAFSSSKKKVATVSADGIVTAKKAGTAVITVRTHNGLSAAVTVKVSKAPKAIALSAAKLSLQAGQTAQLSCKVSGGASAQVVWASSDESVATVSDSGLVTAVKEGVAVIAVATYNGRQAACTVTVGGASAPEPAVLPLTQARMVANLRADSSLGLGGKKSAIVGVVELLMANGFEPAFAAGVASNVYSEGTYGLFESSKYVTRPQKRPKYFCYLDGGSYYGGGSKVTAVYLSREEYDAYTGDAAKYLRFGEKDYYLNNYSKKYAYNVNLTELEAFLQELSKGGWQGKFGLGVVQWTGGRTKTLVEFYRKHAGSGSGITQAQVIAAENEMILHELKGAYSGVYATWKKSNAKLNTAEAANSAGALVCTKYEIPAGKETKAVTRGAKAAAIYKVMIGE